MKWLHCAIILQLYNSSPPPLPQYATETSRVENFNGGGQRKIRLSVFQSWR